MSRIEQPAPVPAGRFNVDGQEIDKAGKPIERPAAPEALADPPATDQPAPAGE